MNIGDKVVYRGEYGLEKSGTLTAIGSDKDPVTSTSFVYL